MGRVLLATLAGAVVHFAWGMAAWMALPIHESSVRKVEQEEKLTAALQEHNLETGLYVVPGMPTEDSEAAANAFMERHRRGPIFSIMYTKEGGEPMSPATLGGGFAIDFGCALLASVLVFLTSAGCSDYFSRLGVVAAMGLFLALGGHVAYYNWMWFPLDHTLAMCVDVLLGWVLTGAVIAAIIRPPAKATATT